MVILTGPAIRDQVQRGTIEIDPYVPEHVNPASVDLTLGDEVLIYNHVYEGIGFPSPVWNGELDAKKENPTKSGKIGDNGIKLYPNQLYLMHTVERVCAKNFVCVHDGKSSLGRLGVSIHQTAGYGDPFFDGQYTMEVTCVLPVRLYAGMRIAQIRFHTVHGEIEKYVGNYRGETARGPVASKSWKQF